MSANVSLLLQNWFLFCSLQAETEKFFIELKIGGETQVWKKLLAERNGCYEFFNYFHLTSDVVVFVVVVECILVPAVADGSCVLQHIMSVMVLVLYSGGSVWW